MISWLFNKINIIVSNIFLKIIFNVWFKPDELQMQIFLGGVAKREREWALATMGSGSP